MFALYYNFATISPSNQLMYAIFIKSMYTSLYNLSNKITCINFQNFQKKKKR